LQWKLLIHPQIISQTESEKISNHRVQKKLYHNRQPCHCTLDCIRQYRFVALQLGRWIDILLTSLIGIYGILKFLGCFRPSYNCKKCTFGSGRLAALYFGIRSLKDYTKTYGLVIAIFFHILLGAFPAIVLLISTLQVFTVLRVANLAALLLISVYSGLTWRTTRKP